MHFQLHKQRHQQQQILDPSQIQLSFAGCGFLCIYHAGVCAAIKEYAPQLAQNRLTGTSAGALAAAALACNVCMSLGTSIILRVVTEARSGSFQALSPNFDIYGLIRQGLENCLPENAHILCSGRLSVSVTRVRDKKNVLITEFDTREELIQAICCSSFIPIYCGLTPPTYRGEQYFDGGFSDNQPAKFMPGTVTVSPFSGESDICPSDEDSASLFGIDFNGTSIQCTTPNLFRIIVTLFPPAPEICTRICRQGFEDTLRFLVKNHLVPCVKCLTIQSNAIETPSDPHTIKIVPVSAQQNTAIQKRAKLLNHVEMDVDEIKQRDERLPRFTRAMTVPNFINWSNECERCMEPLDQLEPPRFTGIPLPSVVQKILSDVEAKSAASWMNWLRKWRPVRYWLRFTLPPVLLPFELFQFTMNKMSYWFKLNAICSTDAHMQRFQQFVDFLLQQVEEHRLVYSPGIFPASSILPVGPPSKLSVTAVPTTTTTTPLKDNIQQQQRPNELPLQKRKLSMAKRITTPVPVPPAFLDLAVSKKQLMELEIPATLYEPHQQHRRHSNDDIDGQLDSNNDLEAFCKKRDAILAFYYTEDETNQLKICQIFDADGRLPRQHCHSSTLTTPLKFGQPAPMDETEAAASSSSSKPYSSMTTGKRRENAGDVCARGQEDDSGLSLEEEEEVGNAATRYHHHHHQSTTTKRTKRDACCSPVRNFEHHRKT